MRHMRPMINMPQITIAYGFYGHADIKSESIFVI